MNLKKWSKLSAQEYYLTTTSFAGVCLGAAATLAGMGRYLAYGDTDGLVVTSVGVLVLFFSYIIHDEFR